ncbi:hypothetical protein HFN89_05850 [Rhizobium laguerreae]|nr:hypothetical protein [Rhizobium laguerreae]
MTYEEIRLYQRFSDVALKAATQMDLKCRGLENDVPASVTTFLEPFQHFCQSSDPLSIVEFEVLLTIYREMGQTAAAVIHVVDDAKRAFGEFVTRCLMDVESDRRHTHTAIQSALLHVHSLCLAKMTHAA